MARIAKVHDTFTHQTDKRRGYPHFTQQRVQVSTLIELSPEESLLVAGKKPSELPKLFGAADQYDLYGTSRNVRTANILVTHKIKGNPYGTEDSICIAESTLQRVQAGLKQLASQAL